MARIYNATGYSLKGLYSAFKNEEAFKLEVFAAVIFIPVACVLDVSVVERILMIAAIVFVMIIELVNSAIEAVVDRVGLEWHELSKLSKDISSAAVFLSVMLALFVWLSILLF